MPRRTILAGLLVAVFSGWVLADGLAVDRVYEPYVNPLEKEIEYRLVQVNDGESGRKKEAMHRLGFAAAVTDRLALEAYIIGDDERDETIDTVELEARYQLTEQGEYAADWGVLFEYERDVRESGQELGATVLVAKQIGRMAATLNAGVIYEKPNGAPREFDTTLSAQLRYRYRPALEPALEVYAGEDYRGMGPVATGRIRFANASSLHWQLGAIFGLDSGSEDTALRFLLEYEFY